MTDLQKCEFELLKTADEICRKLGLKYFLVCGSALGDDIDIALFRKDYELFVSQAPKFLPDNLFLQNRHTEKYFLQIYSKLRNSETTYIEKSVSSFPINHGVSIDIFPLDEYPASGYRRRILELKKQFYLQRTYTYFNISRSIKGKIFKALFSPFNNIDNISKIMKNYECALASYKGVRSDIICNHGNWQGKLEYAPRSQYGNGMWAEFEGLKVRVPEKYDDYLTQKYGDWRADLPKEQQNGHHYYEICDLDRPYTDYVTKLPNGRLKIKNPD